MLVHAAPLPSHLSATPNVFFTNRTLATTQVDGKTGNSTPRHAHTPSLTDRHQKLQTWFFSPYARNCASKCLLSFFCPGSSNAIQARPPNRFSRKIVKRRGSAHGCAFSGLENLLTF